tara:strand:+ start:267 stop:680 length:414 start_codon:yes stop_codon:yes gene_type:complete
MMPEETLNEAIQKTNFHSLFKQLMTDAKKDKYREFNFIVEDPQDRWIIQVRRKYQNLFEQGLDMLNLTTKAYAYTDHTLSIDWRQDEDDDYKRKLCFNFFPSTDSLDNVCIISPDYRFDCDTFFKDLRYALFLETRR